MKTIKRFLLLTGAIWATAQNDSNGGKSQFGVWFAQILYIFYDFPLNQNACTSHKNTVWAHHLIFDDMKWNANLWKLCLKLTWREKGQP